MIIQLIFLQCNFFFYFIQKSSTLQVQFSGCSKSQSSIDMKQVPNRPQTQHNRAKTWMNQTIQPTFKDVFSWNFQIRKKFGANWNKTRLTQNLFYDSVFTLKNTFINKQKFSLIFLQLLKQNLRVKNPNFVCFAIKMWRKHFSSLK